MFLGELRKIHPTITQRDFNEERPDESSGLDSTPTRIAENLKVLMKTEEYEEKGDYLMATLAMPYVQGMILYVLSITFPFFAFCLVIPGKQGGFLLWFGLWVWVKSWDVFFSFVMLIDNILYHLLPHGPPVTNDVLARPEKAFEALLAVDPNYSVYTYYHILALCLTAIPIISGFLVKKGGQEFLGALGTNLSTFSGRVGESMGLYSRALKAQSDLRQSVINAEGAVERAAATALKDPIVQAAMARIQSGTTAATLLEKAGNAPSNRLKDSREVLGNTIIPANQAGVYAALAQASVEQAGNILDARVRQLMGNARYNEALGEHNKKLSRRAIMLGFNSHEFLDPVAYPGGVEAALKRSFYIMPLEAAWNRQVSGTWSALMNDGGIRSQANLYYDTPDPSVEYYLDVIQEHAPEGMPRAPGLPKVFNSVTNSQGTLPGAGQ